MTSRFEGRHLDSHRPPHRRSPRSRRPALAPVRRGHRPRGVRPHLADAAVPHDPGRHQRRPRPQGTRARPLRARRALARRPPRAPAPRPGRRARAAAAPRRDRAGPAAAERDRAHGAAARTLRRRAAARGRGRAAGRGGRRRAGAHRPRGRGDRPPPQVGRGLARDLAAAPRHLACRRRARPAADRARPRGRRLRARALQGFRHRRRHRGGDAAGRGGGGRVLGALRVERPADQPFDALTLELIEVLAALAGPILERGRRDDRWLGAKIADSARDLVQRVVGPSHLKLKIALAMAAIAVVLLATVRGDFRVASAATLEPVIRQALTAPFAGYVAQAPARAGDIVGQGALMATLDDRELRLNRLKWLSQQEQLVRQYHQAMANRNWAAVVILTAQIEQAKSEVSLIDYQLAHTRLTAPFRGIIVTGDLSQSLAAPVERGQVLFELAPLDAYRVVLQVNERDVAYVKVGQGGRLLLTGSPSEPMAFVVEKVTPVSTSKEGHYFFRVEAKLDRQIERLRPGMEGVGKVEIDRRLYAWIWTRQVIDWLRLQLWKWLP